MITGMVRRAAVRELRHGRRSHSRKAQGFGSARNSRRVAASRAAQASRPAVKVTPKLDRWGLPARDGVVAGAARWGL